MKWELDDNARSGFHYLVLGLLIIGLPALLFWGFDTWHAAGVNNGDLPLGVFHNGYLLFDGNTTAVADTSRGERLGYACMVSVVVSVIGALVVLPFSSASAGHAGRWTFVVTFVWCSISALFLPRTCAKVTYGKLEVHQRKSLIGDITVPFTTRTTIIDWSKNDRVLGYSIPAQGITDPFRMGASTIYRTDTITFATTVARGGYVGLRAQRTQADKALAHMDSLLFDR